MKMTFVNLGATKLKLDKITERMVKAAEVVAERRVIEAVNFAQMHGPWTDRTGNARRSISYHKTVTPHMIRFWFYIGVEYGVWLELSNQGKYRILRPTASIYGQKMQRDLTKLGVL